MHNYLGVSSHQTLAVILWFLMIWGFLWQHSRCSGSKRSCLQNPSSVNTFLFLLFLLTRSSGMLASLIADSVYKRNVIFVILCSPRQHGYEDPGETPECTRLHDQGLGASWLPEGHRAGREAAKSMYYSKQVRYIFSTLHTLQISLWRDTDLCWHYVGSCNSSVYSFHM